MKLSLDINAIATIKTALNQFPDTGGRINSVPDEVYGGKMDATPFHIHDTIYALVDKISNLEKQVEELQYHISDIVEG
ncbi:MAG TPA: hypothetical protein VIY48_05030 [Candidatus Paceibacterota bacterium]